MTQWARAGDVLQLGWKNSEYSLVDEKGVPRWVRNGTKLLFPAWSPLVIQWRASAGPDLFVDAVELPDGSSVSVTNFCAHPERNGASLLVLYVPGDMKIRPILFDKKWFLMLDPDVGMSRFLPRGGSF